MAQSQTDLDSTLLTISVLVVLSKVIVTLSSVSRQAVSYGIDSVPECSFLSCSSGGSLQRIGV